jgi:hypothetical protein
MMETIVCWCTTITMMETIVFADVHQQTMVPIIAIVVHQQIQWFSSLLLLYISRHNGFHHCYCCTSTDNGFHHETIVCWCTTITMMETIVFADVQQ